MKSSLLLFFLSLTLMAGKGDFQVVAQEFTLDPYQIVLNSVKAGRWHKVSLKTLGNKKLDCYGEIFFSSDALATFEAMVTEARKSNQSLNFATSNLFAEAGNKHHTVSAQNFSQVWQLNPEAENDLQWKEMKVKDFRNYYSLQSGSSCWPFSACEPLRTSYRISGYSFQSIDYYPDSWQSFLEQVESLQPNDIIYISKYLSLLADSYKILSTIPGERIFRLDASPESESAKLLE